MSSPSPTRDRFSRILPYSGRAALIAALALILMLLVLVAVALYVASQEPPATEFERGGPASSAAGPAGHWGRAA